MARRGDWPMRRCSKTIRWCAAFGAWSAALGGAVPAWADDAGTAPDPSGAAAQPRVVISVSRAADIDPARAGMIQIQSARPRERPKPAAAAAVRRGSLVAGSAPVGVPLPGAGITSSFGGRINPVTGQWAPHAGIDLAAAQGRPVAVSGAGTVTRAGWLGNYGIVVIVDHGGGVETRYAHLSALAVTAGSQVGQGQIIGYVGSTGRSTGPHLHYEVRRGGRAVDPASVWGR